MLPDSFKSCMFLLEVTIKWNVYTNVYTNYMYTKTL